ncbi:hypothetical protein FB107DRAFT_270962 [Schizophyllum commune]
MFQASLAGALMALGGVRLPSGVMQRLSAHAVALSNDLLRCSYAQFIMSALRGDRLYYVLIRRLVLDLYGELCCNVPGILEASIRALTCNIFLNSCGKVLGLYVGHVDYKDSADWMEAFLGCLDRLIDGTAKARAFVCEVFEPLVGAAVLAAYRFHTKLGQPRPKTKLNVELTIVTERIATELLATAIVASSLTGAHHRTSNGLSSSGDAVQQAQSRLAAPNVAAPASSDPVVPSEATVHFTSVTSGLLQGEPVAPPSDVDRPLPHSATTAAPGEPRGVKRHREDEDSDNDTDESTDTYETSSTPNPDSSVHVTVQDDEEAYHSEGDDEEDADIAGGDEVDEDDDEEDQSPSLKKRRAHGRGSEKVRRRRTSRGGRRHGMSKAKALSTRQRLRHALKQALDTLPDTSLPPAIFSEAASPQKYPADMDRNAGKNILEYVLVAAMQDCAPPESLDSHKAALALDVLCSQDTLHRVASSVGLKDGSLDGREFLVTVGRAWHHHDLEVISPCILDVYAPLVEVALARVLPLPISKVQIRGDESIAPARAHLKRVLERCAAGQPYESGLTSLEAVLSTNEESVKAMMKLDVLVDLGIDHHLRQHLMDQESLS